MMHTKLFLLLVMLIAPMQALSDVNQKHHQEAVEVLRINPDDIVIGNRDAQVKIFQYSSLACPHCATFHEKVFPLIKEHYIDQGKVAYIFRDFPTNHASLLATMLVQCAGGKKMNFIDTLFRTQKVWAFNALYKDKLHNIAKLGGISDETYRQCIEDKARSEGILQEAYQAVGALKIDATPVFFINGKKIEGVVPYHKFSEEIEVLLNGSSS